LAFSLRVTVVLGLIFIFSARYIEVICWIEPAAVSAAISAAIHA
jgi:hypothetical protein